MLIGYARVSTEDQKFSIQIDAIMRAGVDERNIFKEEGSGAIAIDKRPALQECLNWLKKGDSLIIYKLDRLGRSVANLIEIVDILRKKEVELKSLTENLDTSTPTGMLMFNVIGSLTAFERDLFMERSKAGMIAAKERGMKFGRPEVMTEDRISKMRSMMKKGVRITDIAKELGISRSPIYRLIKQGFKIHV